MLPDLHAMATRARMDRLRREPELAHNARLARTAPIRQRRRFHADRRSGARL